MRSFYWRHSISRRSDKKSDYLKEKNDALLSLFWYCLQKCNTRSLNFSANWLEGSEVGGIANFLNDLSFSAFSASLFLQGLLFMILSLKRILMCHSLWNVSGSPGFQNRLERTLLTDEHCEIESCSSHCESESFTSDALHDVSNHFCTFSVESLQNRKKNTVLISYVWLINI